MNWRSHLQGAARVFNLFGSIAHRNIEQLRKRHADRSDADAIRADWEAVGRDMCKAMDQVARAHSGHRPQPWTQQPRSTPPTPPGGRAGASRLRR